MLAEVLLALDTPGSLAEHRGGRHMVASPPYQLGKLMVVFGAVLLVVGLLVMAGSRAGFLGLGKLPGDISYKGKNVSFYFPVVTCLLLSALATLILWLISFFRRP
jgi:hypothetical protein